MTAPDRAGPDDRDAWRSWPPERVEREYSPSSAIGGDYAPFVAAWAERSESARATAAGRYDLRFGDGPDDRLDLFPVTGSAPAPLLAFLHGGYWQEGRKDLYHFPAPALADDGIAYAAIEYPLCPATTVGEIVTGAVRAVAWLRENAGALGVDPARIVVAGHSAGGQLVAEVALADAIAGRAPLAGVIPVSGVLELEPIVGTSLNDALGLDVATARSLSPQLRLETAALAAPLPPAVVAWGEHEPSEFGRQSRTFAATWAARGGRVDSFEVAGRNHFDIVFDLGDPATRLGSAIRGLLRAGGPAPGRARP